MHHFFTAVSNQIVVKVVKVFTKKCEGKNLKREREIIFFACRMVTHQSGEKHVLCNSIEVGLNCSARRGKKYAKQ